MNLGYSNFASIVAIPSQSVEHSIAGCCEFFEHMEGVCKVLVVDNFKAAVTKPDRFEPKINERFLDMANYYGFTVMPARVAKPKDKSKVENAVKKV